MDESASLDNIVCNALTVYIQVPMPYMSVLLQCYGPVVVSIMHVKQDCRREKQDQTLKRFVRAETNMHCEYIYICLYTILYPYSFPAPPPHSILIIL